MIFKWHTQFLPFCECKFVHDLLICSRKWTRLNWVQVQGSKKLLNQKSRIKILVKKRKEEGHTWSKTSFDCVSWKSTSCCGRQHQLLHLYLLFYRTFFRWFYILCFKAAVRFWKNKKERPSISWPLDQQITSKKLIVSKALVKLLAKHCQMHTKRAHTFALFVDWMASKLVTRTMLSFSGFRRIIPSKANQVQKTQT